MVVLKQRETVILLHGIGHMRWHMSGVEKAMRCAGYDVINITYPSLRRDLDALAAFVQKRLDDEQVWNKADKVHFVTHSMGGLVARTYLKRYEHAIPAGKAGRFVMLAPPNGGSEIADFLHRLPPYRWLYGPAGQVLCTKARLDRTAPKLCETGIIAGTKGWLYPIANLILPGGSKAHDGRVSVERTKLEGMKDHMMLPATHSFIAWRGDTHGYIIDFIRYGHFRRSFS